MRSDRHPACTTGEPKRSADDPGLLQACSLFGAVCCRLETPPPLANRLAGARASLELHWLSSTPLLPGCSAADGCRRAGASSPPTATAAAAGAGGRAEAPPACPTASPGRRQLSAGPIGCSPQSFKGLIESPLQPHSAVTCCHKRKGRAVVFLVQVSNTRERLTLCAGNQWSRTGGAVRYKVSSTGAWGTHVVPG